MVDTARQRRPFDPPPEPPRPANLDDTDDPAYELWTAWLATTASLAAAREVQKHTGEGNMQHKSWASVDALNQVVMCVGRANLATLHKTYGADAAAIVLRAYCESFAEKLGEVGLAITISCTVTEPRGEDAAEKEDDDG
jgi:hypothetical protein